jgi:hypothetical protein
MGGCSFVAKYSSTMNSLENKTGADLLVNSIIMRLVITELII